MSRRRVRTGRVKVDFSVLEGIARKVLPDIAEARICDDWTLSRKSSLHRRKDGSFTVSLIWKSGECTWLHSTIRGVRPERS